MLGEADNFARWIGGIGVAIALVSFAYGVYRDRRDRPKVEFRISNGLNISRDGSWVRLSLVARNRGNQDIGVQSISLHTVERTEGCGSMQFLYEKGHGQEWRLNKPRTLLARHSVEWQAMPRVICEDSAQVGRMHVVARLLLGNGDIIESNAVAAPVDRESASPYLRTGVEGLRDRDWYESDTRPSP
jgi:hypothetical protein